jgi:hypothetical protein
VRVQQFIIIVDGIFCMFISSPELCSCFAVYND